MTEWKPEAIRKYIFEMLYPLYMKDTQDFGVFAEDPNAEETGRPPTNAVIREAKVLEAAGHIDILNERPGRISVRLTVTGRLFWEQQLATPDQEERKLVGFE